MWGFSYILNIAAAKHNIMLIIGNHHKHPHHHGQHCHLHQQEVVIRLWMGEAGVVVQSLQQGQQQPAFR